jgi:hypothetical protein
MDAQCSCPGGRLPLQCTRRAPNPLLNAVCVFAMLAISGEMPARAQNNYELQVYGSALEAPQTTLVELHNILIGDGTKTLDGTEFAPNGLYYTNDSLHETLEVRQGISSWMEASFYVFTNASSGLGWKWVGDHIRSQLRAPDSWHWPVGAGLSIDFGYQRPYYAADTWTLDIRPIVDKQIGRCYVAFNPAFLRSIHGQNDSQGFAFAPRAKFSYNLKKYLSVGVEYYADYGPVKDLYSFRYQQQQFFPTVDLNFSPDWELNFGVGIGVTASTDDWIYKANVGRRFDWKRRGSGRMQ